MRVRSWILAALIAGAGVALAGPPPGGPPGGGSPGARPPGGPPPGAPPRHRHPPGGGGYWYGPSLSFYYGSPYWWGRPWPYGPYWPDYYGYGHGYSYVPPNYMPPAYVYGPAGVVTSTAGVVYIEREAGTVSTQQPPAEAPAAAPTPPPPPGGQWWYLCDSPRGAYPYVRECPGGWERVPAVPRDAAK